MSSAPSVAPTPLAPARQPGWVVLLRVVAVLCAVAGWYESYDLAKLATTGRAATPWLQQSCGGDVKAGAPSDCFSVLASRYAYVKLPGKDADGNPAAAKVPVSLLGMAYFAVIAIWFLFVGPTAYEKRGWNWLLLLVVAAGALSSASFIWIMAFTLKKWCVGCTIAHAANGGVLLVTLATHPWRRPKRRVGLPLPLTSQALATVTAAGLVAYGGFVVVAYNALRERERVSMKKYLDVVNDPEYALWDYARQPTVEITINEADPVSGPADAPHTLVVFSDFQCPACKLAHSQVAQALRRHPEKLRVVYKHYPQDGACNPRYKTAGHEYACAAARAALAVHQLAGDEAYEHYAAKLFEHQQAISPKNLRTWALELGVDGDAFNALRATDGPLAEQVQADVRLGDELKCEGMPALFVDGRSWRCWRSDGAWDLLLAPPAETQETPADAHEAPEPTAVETNDSAE